MFRHQEIMKVYFQLGSKFNLPNDIVYLLYNYRIMQDKLMIHETKIFYKNMILYLTLGYNIVTLNDIVNTNKDLFNHCLPVNRNLEWGIRCNMKKKRLSLINPRKKIVHEDYRKWLLFQINILSETNYLIDENYNECNLYDKINYLNNCPNDEIEYDYYNYKEWEGSVDENSWRLIVDNYGEGNYI